MRKPNFRKNERGMALIIALLLLLLISAVGLGMVYMSTTETSINTNYKDTQLAFFAMRAGLEEMRDRMRTDSTYPITIPTTAMPGTAGSIIYILNPSSAGDTVDPKTYSNTYFDDEFCHESFVGSGVTYVAPGTACTSSGAPPSASVTTTLSQSPYTNTASSLKYKWVRITLKQNGTFPSALVDPTQTGGNLASQVCWNSTTNQEVVASALGYANCAAAQSAGLYVEPVYLVTAMAITPQGSRRVGQYESAAYNITPPPGALALDGPAATFSPTPSSSQYFANGNNSGNPANSGIYTPFTGPGGQAACATTQPTQSPAISTGDTTGATGIVTNLQGPPDRTGNYTGTGTAPSVVNEGSTGGNQLTGTWSSPGALNNMVSSLANGADKVYTCAIGTPCTGSGPYGTDAAPQVTYVNGDFNFGNASGSGVLIVTGSLNITGNSSFNGLILVVGQGIINESGGGNGQFNGSVFLARTNSPVSPYTQLATLGSPLIAWNGGGTNGIQYNSCWANIGNSMHYMVVASREEMY
ncbi:MAG: hypothetical protein JWQ87_3839 [Candidatus Sulfotelmatobacter sp.]|nr:hypothetical protein [Candidatus Sulfotelmatobacter sp.]